MEKNQSITQLVLKAVALGMSVASMVLGYLGAVEPTTRISLLSIGVFALSVAAFQKTEQGNRFGKHISSETGTSLE
ncbi:MAG: hypothetical protein IH585_03915 [Anaerolineaceae bacterium]|nr:hypothetical protein [Anaerolineaceae bacterium]